MSTQNKKATLAQNNEVQLAQVELSDIAPNAANVLSDATPEQLRAAQDTVRLRSEINRASVREWTATNKDKLGAREEGNLLKRTLNRLQKIGILTTANHMIPEGPLKNAAREMFKKATIDTVKARDLLSLELAERGTLSKIFAYRRGIDDKGLPIETALDIKTITEGDEVVIDFGKNASANAKIGLGDILPPSVQIVKIFDLDMGVRIGTRQVIGGRAGYYDANGKYLPIYSGYTIQVPTTRELGNPDYKKLGVSSIIETDTSKLSELEKTDKAALESFTKVIEQSAREDRVNGVYDAAAAEAGPSGSYKERLVRMIEIASTSEKKLEGDAKSEMISLIERLTKTKEVLGDRDFKLDFDRYKSAIAKHESGGQAYLARNDDAGKKRWVRPGAWAFGKYQFTVETLRGYGVDLGNPPRETDIQSWLGNATLQEQIMDRYIADNLNKHILSNDRVMGNMARDRTSLSYYLALTHIGGPGALSGSKLKADWLGTGTHAYALGVSNVYERSLGGGGISTAVVREERLPGAAMTREDLISGASIHMGKAYKWGADGKDLIDCSQLIVESLKSAWVVHSGYDNSAAGFRDLSTGKSTNEVARGDLVFLRKKGLVSHVAIALGPVENGMIPILDASTNTKKVAVRKQPITKEVEVGTPRFYS